MNKFYIIIRNDLLVKNKIDFEVSRFIDSVGEVQLLCARKPGRLLKTSANNINAKSFASGDSNFIQAILLAID